MTASALSPIGALDGAARRTPSVAPASGPVEVSPGPDVTPPRGVQGYVIDGIHTRQRLADLELTDIRRDAAAADLCEAVGMFIRSGCTAGTGAYGVTLRAAYDRWLAAEGRAS